MSSETFDATELQRLASALPERFDFYHLGVVEPAPDLAGVESELEISPEQLLWGALSPWEDTCIGFVIRGDLNGVLLISFERGLDLSTYMEMGNVIASKMVTSLSSKEGLDLMISPPQALSRRAMELLEQATPRGSVTHRIYLHRQGEQTHSVQAFVIASKGEVLLDA